MTVMIALVGEQPIPNLLPMRYLKPDGLVLVYTKRTEKVAQRLQQLLGDAETYALKIENPYDIAAIRDKIRAAVAGETDQLFNLTGGTKTMVLAAYDLAREAKSPILYLQTEGPRGRDQQSVLYRYTWRGDTLELQERYVIDQPLITLDDYLRVHFEGYEKRGFSREKGGELERAVYKALHGWVDEIEAGICPDDVKEQVEIDLAVRCGNQVGFIEVKGGGDESGKDAVDQLTTAAARELAGTYIARFLVTGRTQRDEYKAVATALNISVVELTDRRRRDGSLTPADVQRLRNRIAERLPCRLYLIDGQE
ncbi:MAG: hypothetical protein ACUVSJ_13690 [Anaerolineae bacterium]